MANQNININPQDLIPTYWHGDRVSTEDDLIFIGSKNLEHLKRYWRSTERSLSKRVKAAQADIDLLAGKTLEDIKAMAAEYENPDFSRIGVLKGNWGDDLEPLDDASVERKYGATTFNVCGWCQHCRGGSLRHNYHITTYCPLIPRQLGNGVGSCGNATFRFNTPCALANGTQELLDACVEHLKAHKAQLVARKQRAASYASYLAKVMRKAEEKPYFASLRPRDWFNVGDRVVFFNSVFDDALSDTVETFVSGKVIKGYRYRNDDVSVCADEPFFVGDCGGYDRVFEYLSPKVLHSWEFDYLKTHPDYLRLWARYSKADLDMLAWLSNEKYFYGEKFVEALMKI